MNLKNILFHLEESEQALTDIIKEIKKNDE